MTIISTHLNDGTSMPVSFNGFKRQQRDIRDANFAFRAQPGLFTSLPRKHDNLTICSPVETQGNLGSCTAQAVVALVEANENKRRENSQPVPEPILESSPQISFSNVVQDQTGNVTFSVSIQRQQAPAPSPNYPSEFVHGSRLFQYYATRLSMNAINQDSGASMRTSIKAASTYGVVDEALWPYDISKFKVSPPKPVWDEAAKRKVTSYHAISDGDIYSMKAALVDRWLVAFGFMVHSEMTTPSVSSSGLLPLPGLRSRSLGGHAVTLVGYDDDKVVGSSKGAFLVRNSWGPNWGLGGYFWMPYAYVGNPKLAWDFWVVQSAPI